MEKTMFADIPLAERSQMLKDNCASCRTETYLVALVQDELDAKNHQVSTNCIKVYKLREELKEIKSRFKELIDPLEDLTKELCREVETGQREVKGSLYDFPDHEEGFMYTFDEAGEFVAKRRLLPEEKQARLFVAHSRTGTE